MGYSDGVSILMFGIPLHDPHQQMLTRVTPTKEINRISNTKEVLQKFDSSVASGINLKIYQALIN